MKPFVIGCLLLVLFISITKANFDIDELLKQKDNDIQAKSEKLNRNFQRMLQFVNILGQVDTFLSERLKLIIRKLALLADDDDDGYSKRKRAH
ncbi:hypothetical protein RI129_012318 [Pyrocoelia pectoralis]|uniref:Uncharacterized protein n=1 Tax=Pyrocoelia pectoralis TaxID=417401 RepID=A0AAN7UYZ8_9COLE